MLNIVDFPTPFGPSNPQISPSLTVNEMSSSICLLLNDNEILFKEILGISFLNVVILNFLIIPFFFFLKFLSFFLPETF